MMVACGAKSGKCMGQCFLSELESKRKEHINQVYTRADSKGRRSVLWVYCNCCCWKCCLWPSYLYCFCRVAALAVKIATSVVYTILQRLLFRLLILLLRRLICNRKTSLWFTKVLTQILYAVMKNLFTEPVVCVAFVCRSEGQVTTGQWILPDRVV